MFSIGPILLEIFFVLLKPQELATGLMAFQPLYTVPGLIAIGIIFDMGRFGVRMGKLRAAPYLYFALALFGWSFVTMVANSVADMGPQLILLGTAMLMALPLAHAVQTWTLYRVAAAGLLAMTLFFSYAASHQALNPTRCFILDPEIQFLQYYDGRPCPDPFDPYPCYKEDDPDDIRYVCEHPGVMNTSSVNGRIRFRAQLEDPNELSLTCGVGLPFAVGFFGEKKNVLRFLILVVSFLLVASCVFFSQSRGGQLVLMVVLGTLFIRRFGWKAGLIAFAVAAVPLLVVMSKGGRSDSEAEGSALERTECLQIGVDLLRLKPIVGVGKGQFTNYHFLTAHNSYVLAAAELGVLGFAIWSAVVYLMVKIPISAIRALDGRTDVESGKARTWATCMLASALGMVVGSFFLSFTFHPVLWIYVGMSGALAQVLRNQLPGWRVGVSAKEMAAIVAGNLGLMTAIFFYARYKLG